MTFKNPDKTVFFICPFCNIEHVIRNEYGNVYFGTAPASIFHFNHQNYVQEIADFLVRREINCIFFSVDVNCNFIETALSGGSPSGLSCEPVINSLVADSDTSFTLSRKIIEHQQEALKSNPILSALIKEKHINVQGMITSKKEGKFTLPDS